MNPRIGPDRITIFHAVPTKWHWVVWHPENLTIGANVDIGAFTAIFAHHGVTIEDDVQIGSHCSIYSLNTINSTNITSINGVMLISVITSSSSWAGKKDMLKPQLCRVGPRVHL